MKPQIIRTENGEELVVITKAEYDALTSRADPDAEDAADIALFDQRLAEHQAGLNPALPAEVTEAMLKGDSLLRALRHWRDLTQAELASKTGLAQGYISDLEAGRKRGTAETLRILAIALDIDTEWLTGPQKQ
jgi:DNA-binding XRE family transcriptional regulator